MFRLHHDKTVVSVWLMRLFAGVALGGALCATACNRPFWWLGPGKNIERVLAIDSPDRMVVIGLRRGRKQIQDIRERAVIDETIAFFKRYPNGWVAFAGAFGDYEFQFSRNNQPLIRMGIKDSSEWSPGEAQLNVDNYRKQVPAADVAAFASRLNLPWPPLH